MTRLVGLTQAGLEEAPVSQVREAGASLIPETDGQGYLDESFLQFSDDWHTAYGWGDHAQAGYELQANKGAASGYAPLNSSSKIPTTYLPQIAISEPYVVADIAARDALSVQEGDVAIVQDASGDPDVDSGSATYIYDGAGWVRFLSPDAPVDSVNGLSGTVTLETDDISEGVNNLYFTNARAVSADLARIGTPTYSSVQDFANFALSPGRLTGGNITDAGTETVDVAAGTGLIKATDSDTAEILFFDWPAANGLSVPTDTTAYIVVEYNAGSPQIVVRTSNVYNFDTEFPLGEVVNQEGTLHILNNPQWVGDATTNIIERFQSFGNLIRDSRVGGLILGETGTRNLTMTSGTLWSRLTEFEIPNLDTSGTDTFTTQYRDGAGGWVTTTGVTQWPNTQFDDGSGTLATMNNSAFANLWFYVEADGELVMVYPQAEWSNEQKAGEEQPPSDIPARVVETGMFIGRLTFRKDEQTALDIQSAFNVFFNTTNVTDHGELSNLTGDHHLQYALADGTRGDFAATGHGHSTQYSVTGNGAGTAISLVNDLASPGNGKMYGTDGSGNKGWFDPPAGGSVDETADYDWTGRHTWDRVIRVESSKVLTAYDPSAGTDKKWWDLVSDGTGRLYLQTRTDGGGFIADHFSFDRNGTFDATTIHENGNRVATRTYASNASNISSGTIGTAYLPTITSSEVNFTNQFLNTGSSPTFSELSLSVGEGLKIYGKTFWGSYGDARVFRAEDNNDTDGGFLFEGVTGGSTADPWLEISRKKGGVVSDLKITGNGLSADSDIRLKKNWNPITDPWSMLEPLNDTIGEFDWKEDGRHDAGFNAQKVQEIAPFLIADVGKRDRLSMSQISVIPYLVAAVNDLRQQVKELSNG